MPLVDANILCVGCSGKGCTECKSLGFIRASHAPCVVCGRKVQTQFPSNPGLIPEDQVVVVTLVRCGCDGKKKCIDLGLLPDRKYKCNKRKGRGAATP